MAAPVRINSNVLQMEYAVRGPIPQRAAELARQGKRTIPCNIGNPQALGQRPISYYRQVLSLVEEPAGIDRERRWHELVRREPQALSGVTGDELIATEILDIAADICSQLGTGMGAYTDSAGFAFIREAVAAFIDHRDQVAGSGPRADPGRIFLTNGASEGAWYVLEMLIAGPTDGVLIPIPQYPLYSAAIRKCGGVQVNYYPDEDNGWSLDREMIEKPLLEARGNGVDVKAIVVINPANPTGSILDEESMRQVVDVARQYNLAIIADEVYQDNLYGTDWLSFARVIGDEEIPLFSLHSVSKGFYGECGHRGGYLEVRNPPPLASSGSDLGFLDVLVKQASVSLCSNTSGQVLTYLMVRPPDEGTPSRQRFDTERAAVLQELYDKATMIREGFGQMHGVECFGRIGAMYLFPRLGVLPPGSNDFDYCMRLLEETGICTVNGSGFGQKPGTQHLRIAFLPPKELIVEMMPRWIAFHNDYVGARS